ncbi:MmpS family transport accessory protein [Mycolicibacterium sp. CBM1]
MNDPRRPDWSDPTQSAGNGYQPSADPAYAGQYYGQGYGSPGYGQNQPTEQLPSSWHPGGGYPPGEPPPPPPGPPKSPKWLWIAAGVAVLLVIGLVIALVIVMSSARESTVVAPLPPLTETSVPRATTSVPTTTLSPLPTPSTSPTPTVPGDGTSPTGTDTVVYNVNGDGRAINITYVDTGGIMQTEFNVMLPWSKEVSLTSPARGSASVAVVNVGRDVTCSVTVNGVAVRERTGRGLTICTGAG